ncbi:YusW family protein [Alkalihalophilus sp. As8PL]|uniref:YusW family protein n=1 Tax=Alkalihalophilus sp. As8PL TaxID=3237103 RepID=A0AB39BVX7_9BACI
MKLRFLLCSLLIVGLVAGVMTNVGYAAPSIMDFELEIALKDGNKYVLEYELKGSAIEAKYQVPGEPVVYGQEAATKVQDFMFKLALTPSSNRDEVINTTLS